ncbi:DnaJ family domain-containing protein [Salinisphaera sp. LB1]|uniref:DnaJ family domain-containing protein n=1 Tax=Salinisphaera sp. LB1 TaxID=2183911 RepID=UPI000D7065C2|nr:DnaJ family domain-containing protein [Salinisphaera sp. LB1]AWN15363.1 Putative cytoplasmic protein [Salinisphaera sp. LB1]
MSLLDRLADAHIEAAAERGELDDLPGAGKPLPADDAANVPEHLRAGYRLLKNAGYVPPEIETRRELREVEDLLARTLPESDAARELTRRARWIELRLAQSPRGRALLRESDYSDRIRERLAAAHDTNTER